MDGISAWTQTIERRLITAVVNGQLREMPEYQYTESNKMFADLCIRIERMCRYSPLDTEEMDWCVMKDRDVIAGLYKFYRDQGDDEKIAARKARISGIRFVLNEVLT